MNPHNRTGINTIAIIAACLLCALSNGTVAGVISVPTGFEVSYGVNMNPGSSNGSDIQNTFIFEWNDTYFNVDYDYTIAGRGKTYISHTIDFAPTSALLIGYGVGVPGVGDEKDHLYTLTNSDFLAEVAGLKWSQAFPGVPPEPRVGHNAMITLLIDAVAGDLAAVDNLTNFVITEGVDAAFDPTGGFSVVEWSFPIGAGTSIPEPATLVLFGLALAILGVSRSRKA